jgi:hypothetical protein
MSCCVNGVCAGLPSSPQLDQLVVEAAGLQAEQLAQRTQQSYLRSWTAWVRFCIFVNCLHLIQDPTEGLLCAFVAFLGRSCTHGTVRGYLKGVKHALIGMGSAVADWSGYPRLYRTLQGLRRSKPDLQRRKLPIEPWMLVHMLAVLPADLFHLSVFVAMVVGFFTFLRKSNLVVGGEPLCGRTKHLLRRDVVIDPRRYCLWVSVKYSKTNQYGERVHRIPVAGARGSALDPVDLWGRYVLAVPAEPGDPAFCYKHGADLMPLTHTGLVTGMKLLVSLVGVDDSKVSGHSLRRGGATYAFQSGVSGSAIKAQGDWQSDCWMRYCELSPSDQLGITQAMQSRIQAGHIRSDPGQEQQTALDNELTG